MNKLSNPLSCILLVDDDPTTNFLHQTLLEDIGVSQQIMVATNGRDALEKIGKYCLGDCYPQLILLDINMPVMNGFEFLEAYRNLLLSNPGGAPQQSVVIVMLTTSMNPHDVGNAQGLVDGFLNKPLTEAMIHHILKTYFSTNLSAD